MLRCIWDRNFRPSLLRNLGVRYSLNTYYFHSSTFRQASPRPRYVRFSSPNPNPGPGRGNGRKFFGDRAWPMKVGAGLAGVGVICYVSCLEQVPETGRWRFISISPKAEVQVGQFALQQTLAQFQGRILPDEHPVTMQVKRVVQTVLDASHLGAVRGYSQPHQQFSSNDFANDDTWSSSSSSSSIKSSPAAIASAGKEWTVIVVDERKIVNAAATPGAVIVFTGILPICKDEQGLAAVLSHEIGHVVARHAAERLSSQTIATALTLFLSALGLDFGISALLNKFLLELPNSRLQEREADLIGLRLMSKACYDPKASPAMFARLGQLQSQASRGGFSSPEFFNTHPSSESRVREIESHLGEAYALIAANPACAELQERVQAFKESARLKNAFDLGPRLGRNHDHIHDEEEVWR
ncbi:peptidase family M48-domain-containing protein [Lentinula lateritia]|uniref:Peptidase family M48-domain-containing protein n=1 Tax=Lentinula lateritia TaxID=40482 RepID=A0ABQ8VN96_9AGAR|nr:peptidase family M48-domain-containing protein [Lentinula lateritia]